MVRALQKVTGHLLEGGEEASAASNITSSRFCCPIHGGATKLTATRKTKTGKRFKSIWVKRRVNCGNLPFSGRPTAQAQLFVGSAVMLRKLYNFCKHRWHRVLPRGKKSDLNFYFIAYFQPLVPKNTLYQKGIIVSHY